MTQGEFPYRSFTMRSEGYDRTEVDSYVAELQTEIVEQRRALATATEGASGDTRLHDPEGAVSRTLAIAQETADRVLHDAQVEADRRRAHAEEHSTTVMAEADERAARLLSDMEAQAADVREQGVAAARSAIQVERDKAMAELAHVRRVRDDLRTEALELKAALDRYRSQAREASDTLAAASSGPLMSLDLPDFVDDDVVLAGIGSTSDTGPLVDPEFGMSPLRPEPVPVDTFAAAQAAPATDDPAVEHAEDTLADLSWADSDDVSVVDEEATYLRAVEDPDETGSVEAETDEVADFDLVEEEAEAPALAPVIDIDAEIEAAEAAATESDGGTFLAEVRAAADDDVVLPPEDEGSDRFLSELRGLHDDGGDVLDSDAADLFFDNE